MEKQITTDSKDKILRWRETSSADVSFVAKDEKCLIEGFIVTNATATSGFLQIHDAEELPNNGATPILTLPLPASGVVSLDDRIPIYCENGAVFAVSTTLETLTISTNDATYLVNIRK